MESKTLEELDYSVSKEIAAKTDAYMMADTKLVLTPTKQVADIASGGMRKRKFGLMLSLAVVPDLDKQDDPVMISQGSPSIFIDGDNLDDLCERAKEELEVIIRHTKDVMDGKVPMPSLNDLEGFQKSSLDESDANGQTTDTESDIRLHTN
jgi:hypothetical protein